MLISVIIPTHNRVSLLEEAIASVIREAIPSGEIIIADDGSIESFSGLVEKFSNTNLRIILSRTDECHGAQVARNRGLALSKGETVLFLDSDDVLVSGGLMTLLDFMNENPEADYAYGKVIMTDGDLYPLGGQSTIGEDYFATPREIAGYHWHTMGALYRRKFLETVGPWDERLTGSQDWEYQARVKLSGGKSRFVDCLLGYWRQHSGSRIGARAFRPDYVRSVMVACSSILTNAKARNFCDSQLENRIARKLVVHALEWGKNGFPRERRECLLQAAATIESSFWFRKSVQFLSLLPPKWDAWIWQQVVRNGSITKIV